MNFPDFLEDVKFTKLNSEAKLPLRATKGSSGYDLFSEVDLIMFNAETKLIPTGISVSMPEYLEMQIRTKSGLAYKRGLVVLNSPGTVDSDYEGEIMIILTNVSGVSQQIKRGMKIAQGVFSYVAHSRVFSNYPYEQERKDQGFGSTGE